MSNFATSACLDVPDAHYTGFQSKITKTLCHPRTICISPFVKRLNETAKCLLNVNDNDSLYDDVRLH